MPIVLAGEGRLAEGMKLYIRLLLAMGVPEADIRSMLVTNPSWLLGIKD